MANSMPFNSIAKDRIYKAEDWAWYFSTFIGNGVFPNPSTGLQVLAKEGMKVSVQHGYAFINGYAYRNPTEYDITIDTADGSFPRIDRVVVRWDIAQRDIYLTVIKGTVSAKPTAPAITRNTDVYDLVIAEIYVGKGVTSIAAENITDTRLNSEVCGIVTQTVKTIDTTTLYNQLTAAFDAFMTSNETEFDAWFNNIKSQLEGDIAGNLQKQIDDNKESIEKMGQNVSEQIIVDNLLTYPYSNTTVTVNGITFTDNGDGTVTVNGTATAIAAFTLMDCSGLTDGEVYTLSGCPKGGAVSKYRIYMSWSDFSDIGEGYTGKFVRDTTNGNYLRLQIAKGETVNNITFKPMLEEGAVAHPYQPYNLSRKGIVEQIIADNLLIYPYRNTSKEASGIKWVDVGDGTVIASGTNTGASQNLFDCRTRSGSSPDNTPLILPAGTYTLSGCPKGGSSSTYYIQVGRTVNGGWNSLGADYGEGVTFTLTEETQVQVQPCIRTNAAVSNIVFKPMIEKGSVAHPYQPYGLSRNGIEKNYQKKMLSILIRELAAWTAGSGASGEFRGMAYGNDKFVAVSNGGAIYYSMDGITWAAANGITADLYAVTYGNGKFVAVGATGTVIYSTDGITWTAGNNSTTTNLLAVTYGNGKFVAVGASGTTLYSTDGIKWTVGSGASGTVKGVTYGNDRFVAVSSGGAIYYSTDGITWTAAESSNNTYDLYAVTYGNDRFVAVGNSGMARCSKDGITWTAKGTLNSQNLNSVTYGNGVFVAVGNSGTTIYSRDGIDWAAGSGASSNLFAVAYGNGKFVAAGYSNTTCYAALLTEEKEVEIAINELHDSNAKNLATADEILVKFDRLTFQNDNSNLVLTGFTSDHMGCFTVSGYLDADTALNGGHIRVIVSNPALSKLYKQFDIPVTIPLNDGTYRTAIVAVTVGRNTVSKFIFTEKSTGAKVETFDIYDYIDNSSYDWTDTVSYDGVSLWFQNMPPEHLITYPICINASASQLY